MHKLQNEDAFQLSCTDLEPVVAVAKGAVTVSTKADDILLQFPKFTRARAEEVETLVLRHQQHHCTPLCENSVFPGQKCNKFFPQLPSLFCLMARTPFLDKAGQRRLEDIYEIHVNLQKKLRSVIIPPGQDNTTSLVTLLDTLADPPKHLPNDGGFSWHGVIFPNGPVLDMFHQRCLSYGRSPGEVDLLCVYHMSLLTRRHAKYYPRRLVSEVYIVKYNPILLLATQANNEVDIITHSPNVWFGYMAKTGDSQTSLRSSQRELISRGEIETGAHIERMIEAKKREVALGEVFCLIDPEMNLASSNATVRYVLISYHPAGVDTGGVLVHPNQAVLVNYSSRYYKCSILPVHIFLFRPLYAASLTLGQFVCWYRTVRKGEDDSQNRPQDDVPVISPADLPPPADFTVLPVEMELCNGTTVKKMRSPMVLDWGPGDTNFGRLMLFQVFNIWKVFCF